MELWQPPAENYWTGGYIYNHEIARHSPVKLRSVASDSFLNELPALMADVHLILDSLYLYQSHWQQSWPRERPFDLLIHHLQSCDAALSHSERQLWADVEAPILHQAQALIVTSHHMARHLQAMLPDKPLLICRPGVDDLSMKKFRRLRHSFLQIKPAKSLQFLSVAHITARKGYLPAAQLLCYLHKQAPSLEWQWHIIGSDQYEPDYAEEFRQLLAKAGLIDRVHLYGLKSPEEVLQSMTQAEVLFLPSLFETFGMVALEALSLGLPVIAHNQGEMPQLISEPYCGQVIPLLDLERSCHILLNYFSNRDHMRANSMLLLQRQTLRSWQLVAEEFFQGISSWS